MPIPFIWRLVVGVGAQIIGFMLQPQPKKPKPPSLDDFPEPTVSAGRPIPKQFGSMTISDPNVLWYGNRKRDMREIVTDKK